METLVGQPMSALTKKMIALLIGCGSVLAVNAQVGTPISDRDRVPPPVEKSFFEVHVGFLGAWAHYEARLSNSVTLRGGLGLFGALGGVGGPEVDFFSIAPSVMVEPRWYYNRINRARLSKDITGNSGNFLSLKIGYIPILLVFGTRTLSAPGAIILAPAWGIRRNIGRSRFSYELGLEAGIIYYYASSTRREVVGAYLYPRLHIGYRFCTAADRQKKTSPDKGRP